MSIIAFDLLYNEKPRRSYEKNLDAQHTEVVIGCNTLYNRQSELSSGPVLKISIRRHLRDGNLRGCSFESMY
jgi:hypothetical protein